MGANESSVNAYFVMDNKLYMKSGGSRSGYVAVAKSLKIVRFSNQAVQNTLP